MPVPFMRRDGLFYLKDFMESLSSELVGYVVDRSHMAHSPLHGYKHWSAVAANGALLATVYGFPRAVTDMFALFHDSKRHNETDDVSHGLRGAFYFEYVLRNKYDDFKDDFHLLIDEKRGRDYIQEVIIACHIHTFCIPHGVSRPLAARTLCQLLQQSPVDLGVTSKMYDEESINLINCCIDADRLDIGRVGTPVCSHYLFTDEAKRLAEKGGRK